MAISSVTLSRHVAVAQQPAQMLVYGLAGNAERSRGLLHYVRRAGFNRLQEEAPNQSSALSRVGHIQSNGYDVFIDCQPSGRAGQEA